MRDFMLARMKEKTTWRGVILLLGILGVALSPEQKEAIITAGVALIGAVEVLSKEQPKTPEAKNAPAEKEVSNG